MKQICIFFLLSISLIAENSLNQKPEELIRQFAQAIAEKDSSTIKKLCLYHKNLKLLWESPALNIPQDPQTKESIKNAKIHWLKLGDSVKLFGGANIPTNKNMINEKRKICQLRHPHFITPLQLVFLRKKWRIKAHWMIAKVSKDHKVLLRQERADYKIIINGKEYPIHLDKNKEFTLIDGQKVNIEIQKNDTLEYNSKQLNFTYSHQLDLSDETSTDRQTIQLRGSFNTQFLIEIHPKSVTNKDQLLKQMCKIYEENYTFLKAKFDSRGFQDIQSQIDAQQALGKELHTKLKKTHQIDRFYTLEKNDKVILIHSHSTLQEGGLYRKLEKQLFESFKVK